MTYYLIDINVWLALSWEFHPHYRPSNKWLSALPEGKSRLLFCRITELGLLRMLTNSSVMGESVLVIADAFDVVDRWNEDPRVVFAEEPEELDRAFRQAASGSANRAATKVLMDAYLAGFAQAEQAELVTLDKGLGRLAAQLGLRCTTLHSG